MSGKPRRTVTIAPITNSRPPMSPATGIDERLISAPGIDPRPSAGATSLGCRVFHRRSTIAMIAPPATAASTNQPNIDQIAAKSATSSRDSSGSAPSRARIRMARVPHAQRNRQRDTQPDDGNGKPAKERSDGGKERQGENEQQVSTVLADDERGDWTAHGRRGNDERSGQEQPRERRVAADVRASAA